MITGGSPHAARVGRTWKEAERDRKFHLAALEIASYGTLTAGWDGYDGSPVAEETTAQAIRVLSLLQLVAESLGAYPEEITPGPLADGGINIEVYAGGRSLIVQCATDSDGLGLYLEDGETIYERRVRSAALGLERIGSWLFGARTLSSLLAVTKPTAARLSPAQGNRAASHQAQRGD